MNEITSSICAHCQGPLTDLNHSDFPGVCFACAEIDIVAEEEL